MQSTPFTPKSASVSVVPASSHKRSAHHLASDSDASVDASPITAADAHNRCGTQREWQQRRQGNLEQMTAANCVTCRRLPMAAAHAAPTPTVYREDSSSRSSCSSREEDNKSTSPSPPSSSSSSSSSCSPEDCSDDDEEDEEEEEEEEEEESEPARVPPKPKLAATASQSAIATTTAKSATQLSSMPHSALLTRLTCKPSPVHIPPNEISLTYLHAFLTGEECAELIMLSQGKFSHSQTSGNVISSTRTSHSATLHASEGELLVCCIRQRVAELTGAPDRCIEALQVVRYEPGQQYHPHFDSSWYDWPEPPSRPRREFSIFVYLNTMPSGAGGETEFTNIGVKFTPNAGDALFWRNYKDRYSPHLQDGEHAGRPPLSGVKYGLNVWVKFD